MAGEPFVFRDQRAIFNIEGLLKILNELSDEEFASYVNGSKNDFANWIEFSLGNKPLADWIRPLVEKDVIRAVLEDFISKQVSTMIIGAGKTAPEDLLAREILEKNKDFLKNEKTEEHKHEVEAENSSESKKPAEVKPSADVHSDAKLSDDKKEKIEKAEKKSKIVVGMPFEISRKILIRDFVFGLISGMVLGAVLLALFVKLFA
jgi:hypothetical protein